MDRYLDSQAGCLAGKHLQHVASRCGKAATGDAAGWLRRRLKLWELPHSLQLLAEVTISRPIPAHCNFPPCMQVSEYDSGYTSSHTLCVWPL